MSTFDPVVNPIAREWLTIPEVADSLGCSRDLVRQLIRTGELDARKFGRIIRVRAASIEEAGKPLAVGGAR